MSTIAREFTKEQLQQIIETDHVQCGEASALARIALASLEAEAVCVIDQANLDYLKSDSDADVWPASRIEMGDVLLYRAAMLQGADGNSPVIPDEVLSAVRKVACIRADFDGFDGDRRDIGDCLDEAEQELIVTINKYASVIAAAPQEEV